MRGGPSQGRRHQNIHASKFYGPSILYLGIYIYIQIYTYIYIYMSVYTYMKIFMYIQYTYVYATTLSGKRGHEFEREQGGLCRKI